MSGAQLGNHLQKRLGHAPRALGIPKLKTFVREQLVDLVDIHEEGLLVTYRLRSGVARPATQPELAHSPAPIAQDLFRIWKSPSVQRRHLAARYGVRAVTEREGAHVHQALLGVLHGEVERVSATLRDVEALQRTIGETVSSEVERAAVLASLSGTITTAHEGLREAIRRYQEAWLGRRGK